MSDGRRFLYHCDDCNYGNFKWTPAYHWKRMKFQKFVDMVRELNEEKSEKRVYFQVLISYFITFYSRFHNDVEPNNLLYVE